MTQDEADKELGRIVREALIRVINRPERCETFVEVEIAGEGSAMAYIRVEHVIGNR